VSEASIMRCLRHRLLQPRASRCIAPGLTALGVLILSFIVARGSAAHPAQRNAAVTLNFTVTITAGNAPTDTVFWLCPDAKADGTGCDQMNGQGNGPYTYQFATTSDATYHHIIIEWTDGRQPSSNGKDPLPQAPTHTVCSYSNVVVGALGTDSFSCPVDFTASAVTPTPLVSPTVQVTPTNASGGTTPGSSDTNSTLVTGLQIVIGVGLVLLVILLIILVFQRLGARRRP
jgi:hypothetical protein